MASSRSLSISSRVVGSRVVLAIQISALKGLSLGPLFLLFVKVGQGELHECVI